MFDPDPGPYADTPTTLSHILDLTAALTAVVTGNPHDDVRAYYLGVAEGFAVGAGAANVSGLQVAEATHTAAPLALPESLRVAYGWNRTAAERRAVMWACGVLTGYRAVTTDRPDADECATCGRRICTSVDDHTRCPDGLFCGSPDCWTDFPHGQECREDAEPDMDDYRERQAAS